MEKGMERFLNLTKKGADLYRSTAIEMMESTIKDWSKLFGVRAVLIALHNAAAHGEMFEGDTAVDLDDEDVLLGEFFHHMDLLLRLLTIMEFMGKKGGMEKLAKLAKANGAIDRQALEYAQALGLLPSKPSSLVPLRDQDYENTKALVNFILEVYHIVEHDGAFADKEALLEILRDYATESTIARHQKSVIRKK